MAQYNEAHLEPLQQHPSSDILNAAYPDAPYEPGQGQTMNHEPGATSMSPPSPPPANASLPSTGIHASTELDLYCQHHIGAIQSDSSGMSSYQSAQMSPNSWGRVTDDLHQEYTQMPQNNQETTLRHHHGAGSSAGPSQGASSLMYPSEPPPPYDPNQSPSSLRSPARTSATQFQSTGPASGHSPGAETIPMQTMGSSLLHQQSHLDSSAPANMPLYLQPYRPLQAASPHAPTTGDPDKPGLSREVQLRRRRRLKICVVIGAFLVLFFIAILLGVGLGVIRVAVKDDEDVERDFKHD